MNVRAEICKSPEPVCAESMTTPLTEQSRFKVRHVVLRPGGRIGPVAHFHKAKHIVVVNGCAALLQGSARSVLFEAQAADIAIGAEHVIENLGRVDLHMIEVQTGAYLGEDDIVTRVGALA